jgi:hypothetical protein
VPFPGAVPLNQINSLPLLSTDQLAFGGSVSVLGGAINRYFTPAQTGINGALMNVPDLDPSGPDFSSPTGVFGNLLDVRGCNAFTLTFAVKVFNHDQEYNLLAMADCPIGLTWRFMSNVQADITSVAPRSGVYGAAVWPSTGQITVYQSGAVAGPFPLWKSGAVSSKVGVSIPGGTVGGSLGYIQIWAGINTAIFGNLPDDPGALLYASLFATS